MDLCHEGSFVESCHIHSTHMACLKQPIQNLSRLTMLRYIKSAPTLHIFSTTPRPPICLRLSYPPAQLPSIHDLDPFPETYPLRVDVENTCGVTVFRGWGLLRDDEAARSLGRCRINARRVASITIGVRGKVVVYGVKLKKQLRSSILC